MAEYTVSVSVKVVVRSPHPSLTRNEAVHAALRASSHNQHSPNKSSVLSLPFDVEAEVTQQDISSIWKTREP